MSKKRVKHHNKKSGYGTKFEQMVKEYHEAKALLESMSKGSEEYSQQEKHCNALFASAERFFKQNQ